VADASSEFGVLVRTRIACHRLFIGAEIDCFDPSKAASAPRQAAQREGGEAAPQAAAAGAEAAAAGEPTEQQQQQAEQQSAAGQQAPSRQAPPPPPGLQSYLELKTYRLPQHPRQERTLYRFKHPKWRLQSFLAGVPRLALGARDDKVRMLRWRLLCAV
jgi:RAT1-interacting protein